ncbi:MAG: phosphotransacetylase [Methanobrevibacter sp.]|uniref:methanogenesis marker protein Mmp4/MtxX n=1 Tax=Methanobrevibacter sp. TaxID=66852 RepID=UPI0025FEDD8D|nr:methanogenesis marker protein Mmp4/MtxX [Methanobrevibacter sp.]MBE6497407.1 phosphotransacetylase [Methanobrevibacter sp.]
MIRIAIGTGKNLNIFDAIKIFEKNHHAEIILIDNDDDLAKAILNSDIDAVVRGSLPASGVIKKVKKDFPEISRATYVNGNGHEFLLTPVGIDEGNTVGEKLNMAINCGEFLEKLGKDPKIAVLADGRKGDYGRSERISSSIDESEKLTQLIEENTNFEVKNYYILIEQAIKDNCNVIIAPDGIIGNIIFRTLILVNSWPSCGAITFGINGIYIDTSRDQSVEGYLRSLKFAYKLANL